MKTLYLIKHAKSNWGIPDIRDFERPISKSGAKDVNTISSYLMIQNILPDIMLSSCALRAQETTDLLANKIGYEGKKIFLEELYMTTAEDIQEIIMAQDDSFNHIFVIAHNPQISEFINLVIEEHFSKMPSMGVVALNFDIDEWSEMENTKGKVDFFIFPKQFKYYMPKQIRTTLSRK